MNDLQKIFVTGSTGIAGGFAVEELQSRGFPLTLLVRNLPSISDTNSFDYRQGDLNQLGRLDQLSRENIGIVHYACASLNREVDPQIDIDAMKVLLNNWEKGPFVFISSLDVYGLSLPNKIINESYPLSDELGSYALGKIVCESLLIQEAKRRGRTDFTILRAPWIFAPNIQTKQNIINKFLKQFDNEIILPGKTKEEYETYGDCWVDARDLGWLVAESINKPLGGAGNVIGGEFCWHDFFHTLKIAANLKQSIIHVPVEEVSELSLQLFGHSNRFSGSKITQHFQFKPRYQLNTTLREAFSMGEI